jgi:Lipase (class 3)
MAEGCALREGRQRGLENTFLAKPLGMRISRFRNRLTTMAEPKKTVPQPSSLEELNALLPNPGSDGYQFFENVNSCSIEKTLDFRKVNCWWAIEMSYLVYGTSEAFVKEQLGSVGLEASVFGFDRAEPPHIVVAHNRDIMVVAFRGTRINELPDILADISFLPDLTGNGFVHSGFQHALASGGIWEEARRHLSGISEPQFILFTGHSLGAALATIARRIYRDPLSRQIALYTFGSPRTGDERFFCSSYPPHAYRVVNEQDLIPHVPTPPLYGHVGSPYGPDGLPLPSTVWEEFEHRFSGIGAALSVSSLSALKQRLSDHLSQQARVVKPIGDHAPRCYATKIWNSL